MAAPMKNICGLSTLCRTFVQKCNVNSSRNVSSYRSLWTRTTNTNTFSCSTNLIFSNGQKTILPLTPSVLQSVRTRVDWAEPTIVCDRKDGKPKPNANVLKRFYRLNNGLWIRTKAGRSKKLWTKSQKRRYILRQHVVCNAQQSTLLDKMVTKEWKKKTYFVDDPYEPYHKRTNMEHFGIDISKPKFIP